MTKNALNEQLDERIKKANALKIENMNYAEDVKQKVKTQEVLELERQEKHRLAMKKYRDDLQRQIEDTNKRKLFKDIMSDHERRVNGHDLDAYEKMNLRLHAKVVGAKDVGEMQQSALYETGNVKNQPKSTSPRGLNYELAKKFNMVDNVLRRKDRTTQQSANYESPSRIVKVALRNMVDPCISYMRNNTQNRVYGYKGEPYFRHGLNNSAIESPNVVNNVNNYKEQHVNKSMITPLKNAGKSQVFNAGGDNLQNITQGRQQSSLFANNSSDNLYQRNQTHGMKRYVDYNIISGAQKTNNYS